MPRPHLTGSWLAAFLLLRFNACRRFLFAAPPTTASFSTEEGSTTVRRQPTLYASHITADSTVSRKPSALPYPAYAIFVILPSSNPRSPYI